MDHIHMKGYAHRDLKPENIMLDEDFNMKLIDFGMTESIFNKNHAWKGTQAYMSQKLLYKQSSDIIKDDVYACGLILFIMVTQIPPCRSSRVDDPYYKYISENRLAQFWVVHDKIR